MSHGQVKKYSARLYFLECPAFFGNRTSKNLGVLVRRSSEHLKIFFTPVYKGIHRKYVAHWKSCCLNERLIYFIVICVFLQQSGTDPSIVLLANLMCNDNDSRTLVKPWLYALGTGHSKACKIKESLTQIKC